MLLRNEALRGMAWQTGMLNVASLIEIKTATQLEHENSDYTLVYIRVRRDFIGFECIIFTIVLAFLDQFSKDSQVFRTRIQSQTNHNHEKNRIEHFRKNTNFHFISL